MNRRFKRKTNSSKVSNFLLNHIEKNIKEYTIVSLVFLIGIIIGVLFINKTPNSNREEITNYISCFINDLKESKSINEFSLLINSLKKNIILAVFLWFMGSTVIGIGIVYLTVAFRGFCLGYTISSIILTLGIRKGNFVFNYNSFFTKHTIYTMCSYVNSKRNEVT